MATAFDITGQKFWRWTVVSRAPNLPQGQATWLCRCECGTEKVLKSIVIRRGISKSCGCWKLEGLVARSTKHGHSPSGKSSLTYNSWASMMQRCTNPDCKQFPEYGGRGILVCERWKDFANFLADMGEKPPRTSIDRIDNNRGYEPGNCRWGTASQQQRNKRNNHMIEFRGQTKCLMDWSEELGLLYDAIKFRLQRGWSVERVFTTPIGKKFSCRQLTHDGKTMGIAEWSKITGIGVTAIYQRLNRGATVAEALSK